jgi:branched-chain amino acid transport system substrate-binding protein
MQSKQWLAAATMLATAISAQAAVAQTLPDRIKVGAIAGVTGPGAATTFASITSYKMATRDINAAGGILGKQVDLIIADDQNNPTQAVSEARRLVGSEKVHAIVGPPFSTTALAVAPVLTEAKIFFVGTAGSSAFNETVAPYGFSTYFNIPAYSEAIVEFAVDRLKASKIALITDNGAQAKDAREQIKKQLAARKLSLVGDQEHEFNAADVTPQMLSLRRTNPDLVIQISGLGDDGGTVVKAMNDIGWQVPVITQVAAQSLGTYLKVAGADAFKKNKLYAMNYKAFTYCPNDPVGASNYSKFADSLAKFDPANKERLQPASVSLSYDNLWVVKHAAEGSKSLDGPAMAKWLIENAAKIEVISGALSNPAGGVRQLFGRAGLAFTSDPTAPRADLLTPRAGC